MANQINVGIQHQAYEPFESTDSEAENQNADTALADNAAGTNTGSNATIVSPQIEGESINAPLPETTATNSMLYRYGIGDTVILGRPEYAINNRAALAETAPFYPDQTDLASSGLESPAPTVEKPPEQAPTHASGYAKDAASNSAAAKAHGIAVPPHDSAAYAAARDYGAQHGFNTGEIDQAAAVLAYYGCDKQQDCANLLADGGLPFHITSIMQTMGDPRADGTFDVAYALRTMQETQMSMSGDPNAGNRNLPDGRGERGVGSIGPRASVGQGFLDYANEMSASSGTSDVTSMDFSDNYIDPYATNDGDAGANTSQPDLNPLPLLPLLDSNGPMMLPTPDIRVDHELAPIPAIAVAEETNLRTSTPDIPDARIESALNEQTANGSGAGGNAADANSPLTLNPENGQYGRDYGNGVWTYPLETPQIESHNLLATNSTDTIRADPGLVANLTSIYQAYEQGQISLSDALSMAAGNIGYSARGTNAEYAITTRVGGAAQAAGGFVEGLVGLGLSDTMIGAVIGVPIALHGIDNMFAGERTMVEGNHVPPLTVEALEYAGMSPMAAELTNAGIGLVGTVGPGAVRAVAVGRAAQEAEVAANLERVEDFAGAGGNWRVANEVSDGTVVQQANPNNCGPACAEMLLSDRGIGVTQGEIGDGLTSAAGLRDRLNLSDPGWVGGYADPNDFAALNQTGSWSAMMWDSGNRVGHWVVVDGINDAGMVVIRDPYNATQYTMIIEDFLNIWNGNCVYKPK